MSEVGTFTLNVLLFTHIIMQFVEKIIKLHITKLVTGKALIIMFVTIGIQLIVKLHGQHSGHV